jgi:hypothetical protein
VVVNFGLHYLLEDKRAFEEEMRTLLEVGGSVGVGVGVGVG